MPKVKELVHGEGGIQPQAEMATSAPAGYAQLYSRAYSSVSVSGVTSQGSCPIEKESEIKRRANCPAEIHV